MPLTLTIRNFDELDNGSPLYLTLDRRGATIGRAATTDWCLPDANRHISSRHCEIRFIDGRYELNDISTNGTFLRGQEARLPGPHVLQQGDVLVVGQFEIEAALDDATAAAAASSQDQPKLASWKSWTDAAEGKESAPVIDEASWDRKPQGSAISGSGPMAQNWAPPSSAAPAPSPSDAWGPSGGSGSAGDSGWGAPGGSSDPAAPAPAPAQSGGGNVWDQFAASNQVDWARGGFGSPTPAAAPTPPPAAPQSAPEPAQQQEAPAQPPPSAGQALAYLAQAAGIDPGRIDKGEAETMARAGDLLRRLVAGLVVMMEARARAKSQMGAQGTNLELDGNNPLKFVRVPEEALLKLLNEPERGFMNAERAVEDSYKDLQAHQMATLKAMQGALKATLDRFSPRAISARAEDAGVLSKILPGARDAALWKAYEKEFGGVARGSDEAFMDVFAKEFRKAYDEVSRSPNNF
jgi:type VI secretion system FHA domain protein